MLQLAWLTPRKNLENGTAGALTYFKHMFGTKVENYVTRLTAKTKPRAVIVCMIYFPLESGLGQTSWADAQLKALYVFLCEICMRHALTSYTHI